MRERGKFPIFKLGIAYGADAVSGNSAYVDIDIDFAGLTTDRLEGMAAAGEDVIECHRVLAKTGDNIVGELIKGVETFYEWDHYPQGDVYDHVTHSQFYYHAHPQELRAGEHGHFHTFVRPLGMPAGTLPAPLPNLELPKGENDALSHIIGISMDPQGLPIRLFTTNRWVTGEVWYTAGDVRKILESFAMDLAHPSWPVNRWITAMIQLFQPQIGKLLDARDRRVAGWAATHPGEDVYEDRDLEVTSAVDISVDDQMAAVIAALEAK
jgi:hypothetical protein